MGSSVGERNLGARDHSAARIGDSANNVPVGELSLGNPGSEARTECDQPECENPQQKLARSELSLLHHCPPNHLFSLCSLIKTGTFEQIRERSERLSVGRLRGYVPVRTIRISASL
jgi:hypothetical protein